MSAFQLLTSTYFYRELEIVGMWEAFPVPFQSPNPEVCFLTFAFLFSPPPLPLPPFSPKINKLIHRSNILSIAMSMNTALLRQWMFQQGDQEREDTIIHKVYYYYLFLFLSSPPLLLMHFSFFCPILKTDCGPFGRQTAPL